MSKPLIFVLQVVGLILLSVAAFKASVSIAVLGVVLLLVGGWGFRRRLKKP